MNIELSDQELRQILRSLNSVSHEHYVASERTSNAARKAEQAQISGMYSKLAEKIKQAL